MEKRLSTSLIRRIKNKIPFGHEAYVQLKHDDIDDQQLKELAMNGRMVPKEHPVKENLAGVMGQCHALASYLWLCNPSWKLYLGFGYQDEEVPCNSSWYLHSFLVDTEGVIVEPTPLERDGYWGAPLSGELLKNSIREELKVIKEQLKLCVTDEMLALLE